MSRAWSVLALLVWVGVLYAPSSLALHRIWTDGEQRSFTHGYLLVAISLWLIHRDREHLAAAPARAVPLACVVAFLASLAWLVAWRASIQDLHLVAVPAIAWLAVLGVYGPAVARRVALPIGLIYFALPFWASFNGVLQRITVEATRALVWLTGLPAYVEGNFVRVPAGLFEIEGGCSGLHFFVVGLALAVIYGEINRDPLRLRLRWVLQLALLALVANWLRVFTIIVAGHLTDMQHYLVKVDHYTFGWIVFALFFAAFLWTASRVPAHASAASEPPAIAAPPAPMAAPAAGRPSRAAPWATLPGWAAVAGVPAMASAAALTGPAGNLAAASPIDLAWPTLQDAWQGPNDDTTVSSGWRPEYPGATAKGQRQYRDGAATSVEVFQAFYASQQQGAELVGEGSSLAGVGRGWDTLEERVVETPSGAWRELLVADVAGSRSLIRARWYVDRRAFAEPLRSQVWYGIASLWRPAPSAVLAIRADCLPDCAASPPRLERLGGALARDPGPLDRLRTAGVIP